MNQFTFRLPVVRALLSLALLLIGLTAFAQVTTSTISGTVTDSQGEALVGATVVATHVPSGTRYGTATNAAGRYVLPAVRVGGPFTLNVTYTGYEPMNRENIYTNLGIAANVDFQLRESGVAMEEVVISTSRNDIFSTERTGASSNFSNAQVSSLPAVGSRSISSITRYSPQGNSGGSFGAQDSRLNNFTIDGSVFNNGFGLGTDAQAGGRTGSTAISLDAIEQLQINVAPFDVRQSGFVGSGINAVTRSGTNEYEGSAYYNWRNDGDLFIGKKAAGQPASIGQFDEYVIGARFGGPIVQNKLFYFISGEIQRRTEPATTFVADGSSLPGTVTRVKKSDLDELRRWLKNNYGYETGPYEGYNNETTSDKFLVRLDWNVNERNRLTLRYTHHNSLADQPISNSSSLGAGSRRSNLDAMSYQNSGYLIGDNTRSVVAEWNGTLSQKVHNNLIVGYDYQNEDRKYKGAVFPTIDIRSQGVTYISAGFDPFTPDNQLSYGTFHATDNVSFYLNKHTVTVGANYEKYKSDNLFFPGSHGVYIFNSLSDFYTASTFNLNNPDADTSNVKIARFQLRYSIQPNGEKPLQVLKANKFDLYAQDEIQIGRNFRLTAGVRASIITFDKTALLNQNLLDNYRFYNENGDSTLAINTGNMPDPKVLWEPRLGFNWDVGGRKSVQVRGGSGIFTGRPPYVWLSNQIGNNGVLTGFLDQNVTGGSNLYGFTDDPTRHIPEQALGAQEITAADPDYRFPQIWKTNLAVDYKLPFGLIATVEGLYNKNMNSTIYYNANFKPANTTFTGPDMRDRWTQGNRLYNNISSAVIMTNTSEGYYWAGTFKLEYPVKRGFYGMAAYTYSQAKDLMSAGSIAAGSWNGVKTVNGNNKLSLTFADQDMPHRIVGMLGYRIEYGKRIDGATQFTLGYVGERRGFNTAAGINTARYSYALGSASGLNGMNGDGVTGNDLLYIPNSASELTFVPLIVRNSLGTPLDTFSVDEQVAAFDAYLNQDEYLNGHRGQYAERNGAQFPMLHRFDLSVMQEFGIKVSGKRNALQVRADIINVANLLNDEWGVGQVLVTDQPLRAASATADGVPQYTMATQTINGKPELVRSTFIKGVSPSDVWNLQLSIRYIFH